MLEEGKLLTHLGRVSKVREQLRPLLTVYVSTCKESNGRNSTFVEVAR